MNSADYERIKFKIGEVFEENSDFLNNLPIDVFGLARKMGFRLIKASDRIKLGIEKANEFKEINKDKDVFGYAFFDTKAMQYVIYYDDLNAGPKKQRFSVAHEIGHIVLGHIELETIDSKESEDEADYFAGYLMFPDCLSTNEEIFQFFTENFCELSHLFGIAEDTAMIKIKNHNNRHSLSKDRCYDYEEVIMSCLEEAVLTKIRD